MGCILSTEKEIRTLECSIISPDQADVDPVLNSEPISEAEGIKCTDWLSLQHTFLYLRHIGEGGVISQS